MADLGWILIQFCILFFRFPRSKTVRPLIFVVAALTLPSAALGSRTAYVEVSSSGNSAEKDGESSGPVQVKGEFAGIGAVKNAEGDLHTVPPCDEEEEDELMSSWGRGWIGTLHVEENLTSQCGGGATLVDRVKKAMLLGASAILILAFNPQLVKELDISQLFTHPVVVLRGAENITKVLTALTGGGKVRAKVVHEKAFHEAMAASTITLWAACWRARGGTVVCPGGAGRTQGGMAVDGWDSCTLAFPKDWQDRDWWDTAPDVVCKGGTKRPWQTYFTQAWNMVLIFITTLSVLLMLQVRWRTQDDSYTTEQVETALQRLASDALSRMRVKRYKHFHRRSRHGEKEKDACAVCLDHFYPGQAVRVLPCFHEFHRKCVDSWLIKKRTCPLCTINILDKQDGSCLPEN
ncbi:RING finger protein 215-like isoform X1 [Branchiostoma lanceolatum]|uniref:RING finger protein 215-like isoform X1 n=1 Tax=Branchiostoma lanceolatum TaxID=7740 RepID=UPI003455AD03